MRLATEDSRTDWRKNRFAPDRLVDAWALYRIALSLSLVALLASPLALGIKANSATASLLLLLNVIAAVLIMSANRGRVVSVLTLVAIHLANDFAFATLITYFGNGISGGFATLFFIPVAMGALFLPRYAALVPSAVASLILLTIEYRLGLDSPGYTPAWAPAGLLGALLFLVAMLANFVAQRASLDEQIARVAATSLGQMRQLAAQVVERMQTGVLVADATGHVMLSNVATRSLIEHPHDRRSLARREPDLWQAARRYLKAPAQAGFAEVTLSNGRQVWPHFTLLAGDPPLLLIVVDDPEHIARQRQQARLAAIGQLTAGVAHDIRNPLAAISNATQLLADQPDRDREQLLAVLQRQTHRLNRVIERIYDLARPIQPHPVKVNLATFLPQWEDDYRAPKASEFALKQQLPPDLPPVLMDPEHLSEILDNLVDNAIQHALPPEDAPLAIVISAKTADRFVLLTVTDNGSQPLGVGSDKPFEAFCGEGRLGLGLTLCRELMEANRGEILLGRADASPQPSSGTSFSLRIPLDSLESPAT